MGVIFSSTGVGKVGTPISNSGNAPVNTRFVSTDESKAGVSGWFSRRD